MVTTETRGENQTRPYTVHIADGDGNSRGSGVLFYPGGDNLYVFTCAHVVYGEETLRLSILKPIDVAKDRYDIHELKVPADNVRYSPSDRVEESGSEKTHTEDYAVIRVPKPDDIDISPTGYRIKDAFRDNGFYVLGYPNGVAEGHDLVECFERLSGTVTTSIDGSNRFTIRMEDSFIDPGARVEELNGLSGSPIWSVENGQATDCLFGLVSCAFGSTAALSKVFAVRSSRLRVLLRDSFGIETSRSLLFASDVDETAESKPKSVNRKEAPAVRPGASNDKWLSGMTTECRDNILNLQLGRGIDLAKETISDERFEGCNLELQRVLMKHLLYCYEIGDLDEEFDELEQDMRRRGLMDGHDVLRHISRSFSRKDYYETITIAQEHLTGPDYLPGSSLTTCAETYLLLARAYTENLDIEDSIGMLLDDCGNLIHGCSDAEDDALLYQMIGFVYGDLYHDHTNCVRLMERSYSVSYDDSIILESLGAAYYHLALANATREDGTVDPERVDWRSLNKAREYFLTVAEKADDLSWVATMRRAGLCVFNTYCFLQDNYRMLLTYQDVKKHVRGLGEREWRDIEIKHAKVAAQSGNLDLGGYTHLNMEDVLFLRVLSRGHHCLNIIGCANTDLTPTQIRQTDIEHELEASIRDMEGNVRLISKVDRPTIHALLMNLYGWGIRLFGWDKVDKLDYWLDRIRDNGDVILLETMENYRYEVTSSIGDSIVRYKATLSRRRDMRAWYDLLNFFIRNGMMKDADAMYKELIFEERGPASYEPEYLFRDYMEYVATNQRDQKDALRCFLKGRRMLKDPDIRSFLELDLMVRASTFNEPSRFESERLPFVERGLLSEEEYHRTALIAYLVNLDSKKTAEHYEFVRRYPHLVNPMTHIPILQTEEIRYLNWIGAIKPNKMMQFKRLYGRHEQEALTLNARERWHTPEDVTLRNRFMVNRSIVIDAWGLYIMSAMGRLDDLNRLDRVYVSHMSVIQLLDDLSGTDDPMIRRILDHIRKSEVFEIVSADFESQLIVRDVATYTEAASAIALGKERSYLVVLGSPEVGSHLIERFRDDIIRAGELCELLNSVLRPI